MSTNTETDDLGNAKMELPDGSALFAMPHDPNAAAEGIAEDMGTKVASVPGETPDPTADGDETMDPHKDGGLLRRFTEIKSPLGMAGLESLAMDEDETAKAVSARSDEIYRNEFPVITSKFALRCRECRAEFENENLEECGECGATDLEQPDPSERRQIEELFQSINAEGQSMRQVGKRTDEDHSRLGVMAWVLRWRYVSGPDGRVTERRFQELVRGDPKRILPVVDENGRLGGVWWTCPLHRERALVDEDGHERESGTCPECGCGLREVHYAETGGPRGDELEKVYFEHEIVMHASHIPTSHGLDGLAPVHLVWLEQAILHWMDVYAAEFFNPHSSRTPNKFLVVHTPNPDAFERQLDEAKNQKQEDPYTSGVFYNQISPNQGAQTEAQVVDIMGDEFLGQSPELRKRYENHIRTVLGVSDVFDSELEDAGGLNNEGLQLEVTDRSIAAAQQDYSDGPYDELLRYLGYEDWRIGFVPPRQEDEAERIEKLETLKRAAELGLPARMENGEPVIGDGEVELQTTPDQQPDGATPNAQTPDEPEPPDPGEGPIVEELAAYRERFEDAVWGDKGAAAGQKASAPTFSRDEDVPPNVQNRLERAADRVSWNDTEGAAAKPLRDFFVEKLSQPQGWSVDSLEQGLQQNFDIDPDRREDIARTKSAQLLNEAKSLAFADLEEDADVLFFWDGPQDEATTEACEELKQQTNPEFGGDPRPREEFNRLLENTRSEYFPEFKADGPAVHFQERHSLEGVLASEVES